jgi:D-arabinose 1-dehydrogenase
MKAFDTSAYYGPSEIVLGVALRTLAPEFPRHSYKLVTIVVIFVLLLYPKPGWGVFFFQFTKCGRYGVTSKEFDYSPATIRASVQRSLARLGTTYLDVVYLHDVEYVCTRVQPRSVGDHSTALNTEAEAYGLAPGQEAKVWGDGDHAVLNAIAELRKMKQEGLIKNIGISGRSYFGSLKATGGFF